MIDACHCSDGGGLPAQVHRAAGAGIPGHQHTTHPSHSPPAQCEFYIMMPNDYKMVVVDEVMMSSQDRRLYCMIISSGFQSLIYQLICVLPKSILFCLQPSVNPKLVFGAPIDAIVLNRGVYVGKLHIPEYDLSFAIQFSIHDYSFRTLQQMATIIRRNLATEGLFRVSGSATRMKAIQVSR